MVNLGLIGRRLGHSYSADYFSEKFRREGIEGVYRLYPLEEIGDLRGLLDSHPEIDGLNVTIPYKGSVIPLLDSVSEDAASIGAVNVIDILRDHDGTRRLHGYNSDWKGFADSLIPMLDAKCRKAIVLGTGGASKAVSYALKRLGIDVLKVSRTPAGKGDGTLAYSALTPEIIAESRIVVNTTPLGMYPDTETKPDIPYEALTHEHICYDLVYNPEETAFMKECSIHGARVKNGLEMLHRQADIAHEIWKHHFRPI